LVQRQLGATFTFDQTLGNNSAGERIIGACYFEPRFAIFVDSSLASDMHSARFRFTLAHELGHLSLHRKLRLDFQSLDATARAIIDTQAHIDSLPRRLETPRDFLEWQANAYAAGLLMPRATFARELKRQHIDMGITRSPGIVYLNDERSSDDDYREAVARLSDIYQTSRTATQIRLRELDLLRDWRRSSEAVSGADNALSQSISSVVQQLLRRWDSPSDE
jgi:Zn-dependent peptidase ImmA (M78 family)